MRIRKKSSTNDVEQPENEGTTTRIVVGSRRPCRRSEDDIRYEGQVDSILAHNSRNQDSPTRPAWIVILSSGYVWKSHILPLMVAFMICVLIHILIFDHEELFRRILTILLIGIFYVGWSCRIKHLTFAGNLTDGTITKQKGGVVDGTDYQIQFQYTVNGIQYNLPQERQDSNNDQEEEDEDRELIWFLAKESDQKHHYSNNNNNEHTTTTLPVLYNPNEPEICYPLYHNFVTSEQYQGNLLSWKTWLLMILYILITVLSHWFLVKVLNFNSPLSSTLILIPITCGIIIGILEFLVYRPYETKYKFQPSATTTTLATTKSANQIESTNGIDTTTATHTHEDYEGMS